MNTTFHKTSTRRMELAIIIFFALTLLSLFVVYAIDPSIYLQTLNLTSSPSNPYPWQATLFLVCLVTFISSMIIGVLRHWRWLFWLLLVAFSASVLQFPAELLQIFGVLPLTAPLWYSIFRLVVAAFEVGLAVWMIRVYRHEGVWALGRKKRAGNV
jgi:hypothetical protein